VGTPRFPLSRSGFARLKRLQAAAGLVFASYVLVHLGNAAAGLAGPGAAAAWLAQIRRVAGTPAGWLAWIVLPIAIHAAAAAAVILQERAMRRRAIEALRRTRPGAAPRFGVRALSARLHRWSGFALAPLLMIHVLAMRPGTGGYARAARLVAESPFGARAGLAALAACASYHLGYGVFMALVNLGVLAPGRPRRWGRAGGAAIGIAAAAAAAAGIAAIG
jgi:succinate dehydrogenase/fumarate reductase cytochrome b subunit